MKLEEAVGVNMPTVNCSAFTASNVGRLLRGDCWYWTVDIEMWSALIVTWAAGVAIHATFQNRHFRPPKIRWPGLGRTEEKFADSDANWESVTTLILFTLCGREICTSYVLKLHNQQSSAFLHAANFLWSFHFGTLHVVKIHPDLAVIQ